MANLFDLDDALFEKKEEKKETKKDYDVELKKARAFSIRGLKDKALEIYNSILEEDFENEGALVGILRVHSDNFRIFEGKEIENDIFAIESMCPEIMDDEYLSYIAERSTKVKDKKPAAKKEPTSEVSGNKSFALYTPKPNATFKEIQNDGIELLEEGKYEKALSAFNQSLALAKNDEEYFDSYFYTAIALKHLKRYDEAIMMYEFALATDDTINNKTITLSQGMGECYEAIGHLETAKKYYEQAKLKPDPNKRMKEY